MGAALSPLLNRNVEILIFKHPVDSDLALMLCDVILQVSCSAVNECFTYNSQRSRSFYQCSNIMKLQRPQSGQMLLPRKLRKLTRRQTTLFTQRQTVSNCCSDLSTTYAEELPNYLTLNVLQDQSNVKQENIRKVLVILNPYSGFRSSREVFYKKVQSTLKVTFS